VALLKHIQQQAIKDPEFADILNRHRDGEVGDLIRTDPIIQQVGYRHYNLRRHEVSKQDEVRKTVMGDMRELARLFIICRTLSSSADVTV
jgi:hypothetical protein